MLDLLTVALHKAALPAARTLSILGVYGALPVESVVCHILTSALLQIVPQIMAQLAAVAKLALLGRELRRVGARVAETNGVVEPSKVALDVLALLLLPFLVLAFARLVAVVS